MTCEFCGQDEARWKYVCALDPAERLACDTCHILVVNGWTLNLFDRAMLSDSKLSNEAEGRRWLINFVVDPERQVLSLGDGSLPTAGTRHGMLVPVGRQFDEDDHYWRPPGEGG